MLCLPVRLSTLAHYSYHFFFHSESVLVGEAWTAVIAFSGSIWAELPLSKIPLLALLVLITLESSSFG